MGNYIADIDGNKYLDVFTSIACIGMGYDHPSALEATRTPLMKHFLATRMGIGINPPLEWEGIVDKAFMEVAPHGMTRFVGAMCGACSVEGAFKYCFISYAQNKRGGMDVMPSDEDMESTMLN